MQALCPCLPPRLVATVLVASLLMLLPQAAAAAGFSLPFITGIGCDVVLWLKGELAVMILVLATVMTFVIGLFARMDWTRILSIVIVFGILQGIVNILLSTNTIQLPSCFN